MDNQAINRMLGRLERREKRKNQALQWEQIELRFRKSIQKTGLDKKVKNVL